MTRSKKNIFKRNQKLQHGIDETFKVCTYIEKVM